MNLTESPIEDKFLDGFIQFMYDREKMGYLYRFDIKPQVWFERYRVDFCIEYCSYDNPEKKIQIIIECDGQEFHGSKEQQAKDSARDRWFLHEKKICVLRLPGWLIWKDTHKAWRLVREAIFELLEISDKQDLTEHDLQYVRFNCDEEIHGEHR